MIRILLETEIVARNTLEIRGDEYHYLTRVRRCKNGQQIEIRDSSGRRLQGTVADIGPESAVIHQLIELSPLPAPAPVTLFVAIPKRNLLDDVIRKISEIGVHRLVPMRTARSVSAPPPDRFERWCRIAAEAMRQCGRQHPLRIDPLRNFDDAIAAADGEATRLLLHPSAADRTITEALTEHPPSRPICLVIGPEGGFCDAELHKAATLDFDPVTMGHAILRVETVAIAASVLCVARLGGFDRC